MFQSVAVAQLALPPAEDVPAASFGIQYESVTPGEHTCAQGADR